jgi:hypothetical protein
MGLLLPLMKWDLMYCLGILGVRMAGVGCIHKTTKLKPSFNVMRNWMCRNQLLGHENFVRMRPKSFETSFLRRSFWICHIRVLADVTVPWTHFHSHSSVLKSSRRARFGNRLFLLRTEPVSRYLLNNFRTHFFMVAYPPENAVETYTGLEGLLVQKKCLDKKYTFRFVPNQP